MLLLLNLAYINVDARTLLELAKLLIGSTDKKYSKTIRLTKKKKRKERSIHIFILDVESMYKIEQSAALECLLCWEP